MHYRLWLRLWLWLWLWLNDLRCRNLCGDWCWQYRAVDNRRLNRNWTTGYRWLWLRLNCYGSGLGNHLRLLWHRLLWLLIRRRLLRCWFRGNGNRRLRQQRNHLLLFSQLLLSDLLNLVSAANSAQHDFGGFFRSLQRDCRRIVLLGFAFRLLLLRFAKSVELLRQCSDLGYLIGGESRATKFTHRDFSRRSGTGENVDLIFQRRDFIRSRLGLIESIEFRVESADLSRGFCVETLSGQLTHRYVGGSRRPIENVNLVGECYDLISGTLLSCRFFLG